MGRKKKEGGQAPGATGSVPAEKTFEIVTEKPEEELWYINPRTNKFLHYRLYLELLMDKKRNGAKTRYFPSFERGAVKANKTVGAKWFESYANHIVFFEGGMPRFQRTGSDRDLEWRAPRGSKLVLDEQLWVQYRRRQDKRFVFRKIWLASEKGNNPNLILFHCLEITEENVDSMTLKREKVCAPTVARSHFEDPALVEKERKIYLDRVYKAKGEDAYIKARERALRAAEETRIELEVRQAAIEAGIDPDEEVRRRLHQVVTRAKGRKRLSTSTSTVGMTREEVVEQRRLRKEAKEEEKKRKKAEREQKRQERVAAKEAEKEAKREARRLKKEAKEAEKAAKRAARLAKKKAQASKPKRPRGRPPKSVQRTMSLPDPPSSTLSPPSSAPSPPTAGTTSTTSSVTIRRRTLQRSPEGEETAVGGGRRRRRRVIRRRVSRVASTAGVVRTTTRTPLVSSSAPHSDSLSPSSSSSSSEMSTKTATGTASDEDLEETGSSDLLGGNNKEEDLESSQAQLALIQLAQTPPQSQESRKRKREDEERASQEISMSMQERAMAMLDGDHDWAQVVPPVSSGGTGGGNKILRVDNTVLSIEVGAAATVASKRHRPLSVPSSSLSTMSMSTTTSTSTSTSTMSSGTTTAPVVPMVPMVMGDPAYPQKTFVAPAPRPPLGQDDGGERGVMFQGQVLEMLHPEEGKSEEPVFTKASDVFREQIQTKSHTRATVTTEYNSQERPETLSQTFAHMGSSGPVRPEAPSSLPSTDQLTSPLQLESPPASPVHSQEENGDTVPIDWNASASPPASLLRTNSRISSIPVTQLLSQ